MYITIVGGLGCIVGSDVCIYIDPTDLFTFWGDTINVC
jgi:hypothetical protein